ncbi:MAG: S4 domain-containing protein [Burkholderiales bacterium]
MANDQEDSGVRIDKWLWAARFYKTRSLALEAINGGKVTLNGERAKPSKILKLGNNISLRQPPYERHLIVCGLSDQRGGASIAQELYEETAVSIAARTALAEKLRSQPEPIFKGRPTKKARRQIIKFTSEE